MIDADPTTTEARTRLARELMAGFARDTGLDGTDRPPARYLWTDAFAVCNLLGLRETDLALRLVDQVHRSLGRRDPSHDGGEGWLSGLDDSDAEEHPTRGGLRIGKTLAERAADDPFDERLEWDRDGQYFHYLTKWMHALDQVARRTGEPLFNVWARELALVAFRAFTYVPKGSITGRHRMVWKMSVDLTRPLIPSMGHHDPVDGFVTFLQVRATAKALGATKEGPSLAREANVLGSMIALDLSTDDPLGLGGLLTDAWRAEQLRRAGAMTDPALRDRLIIDALEGLGSPVATDWLKAPADRRLAFRELGLAIGLAAVPPIAVDDQPPGFDRLAAFVPLRTTIEDFWLTPEHRETTSWRDHQHINDVMLATSLVPEGYLGIR